MALNPEVRLERFLAGQKLTPAVRLEYFLAGAAGYGLAALQNESPAIASGGTAIATIPDAADNVPLQSLLVQVNPLQEGTGTPSPDNERPIVPRESVTIKIVGSGSYGYEPFTETNYTAKLPACFYGGTADAAKGKATQQWGIITLVGGDEATYIANGETSVSSRCMVSIPGKKYGQYNIKSDKFYNDGSTDDFVGKMAGRAATNGVEFYLPITVSQTADDLKAWFTKNPTQLCYELDTSVEIDIDPVTILTLQGVNNISADTGNILAVEYKQDPEASANEIKALIAPVLTEMKADANLVANDFRIVGNTLYKITANIAAGGTLTPGSNCTATTVGAQLKALL